MMNPDAPLTVQAMLDEARLNSTPRIAAVSLSPVTGQIGVVVMLVGEMERFHFLKILAGAVQAHGKQCKQNEILHSAGDAQISLYLQWLEETDQNWGWSDLTMSYDFLAVSIACFVGREITQYVLTRERIDTAHIIIA